jgi:hypothetical protein
MSPVVKAILVDLKLFTLQHALFHPSYITVIVFKQSVKTNVRLHTTYSQILNSLFLGGPLG